MLAKLQKMNNEYWRKIATVSWSHATMKSWWITSDFISVSRCLRSATKLSDTKSYHIGSYPQENRSQIVLSLSPSLCLSRWSFIKNTPLSFLCLYVYIDDRSLNQNHSKSNFPPKFLKCDLILYKFGNSTRCLCVYLSCKMPKSWRGKPGF